MVGGKSQAGVVVGYTIGQAVGDVAHTDSACSAEEGRDSPVGVVGG
jgi:hypothetical protein